MSSRVVRLAGLPGPSVRGDGCPAGRSPGRRASPAGSAVEVIGGIATVSAALRSGASPAGAWRRGFGVHVDGGVPASAALLVACGGDREAAAVLIAAGRLAARTGAPLADVLDRVGAAMALDREAAGQRAAALAGPRATARLLAWLPASGLGLGLVLGTDPAAVLLDGGPGTMLLVLGTLLTTIGRTWSRRCVRQALAAGGEP